MGRKKIAEELKKVNLCVKTKPSTLQLIEEVAEERMISTTKLIDILINTPTTLQNLVDGIEIKSKSCV